MLVAQSGRKVLGLNLEADINAGPTNSDFDLSQLSFLNHNFLSHWRKLGVWVF